MKTFITFFFVITIFGIYPNSIKAQQELIETNNCSEGIIVKEKTITLFRTYHTSVISCHKIININKIDKYLKSLNGSVKFSGSDIDETNDTLKIGAFFSKTIDHHLFEKLNKGAILENMTTITITKSNTEFEPFCLEFKKPIDIDLQKYLIIQLFIKSGSDDDFYLGESNVIIDNLHFK